MDPSFLSQPAMQKYHHPVFPLRMTLRSPWPKYQYDKKTSLSSARSPTIHCLAMQYNRKVLSQESHEAKKNEDEWRRSP
jgi:hypothetical protein